MTSSKPPGESSSTLDNVIFLDSSKTSSAVGSQVANKEKEAQTTSSGTEADHVDGSITIKSGGLPEAAWQSNATELAKLLAGKQLGIYLIEKSLGTGGMAAVFLAIDPHLNRQVALKVLPPLLAVQQEHVQRFEREAKVAARLEHDNVARVHYYGQDQGLHFIAYEYVEGRNLREVLSQEGGKLSVHVAIDYMLQAARGLAHSSVRGIVHRDIKPSNLVITHEGKVKLVDLGLARNNFDNASEDLTQSGATLGTFDYLAPEQAIDPRAADTRSDIYALGCTFYHALTGTPPVPEGTAARKLHSHQTELPLDPRAINPDVPADLVTILSRMMAKKPADRYQNADELVHDLEILSDHSKDRISLPAKSLDSKSTSSLHWLSTLTMMLALICLVYLIDAWSSHSQDMDSELSIAAKYASEQSTENVLSTRNSMVKTDFSESPQVLEINSTTDFLQAFAKPTGGTLILKKSLYEFNPSQQLIIRGGDWIVRTIDGQMATLRFIGESSSAKCDVTSGSLHLQHVVFEMTSNDALGVFIRDGAQVTFQQSELQRKPNPFEEFLNESSVSKPFIRLVNTSASSLSPVSLEVKGSIWHPSSGTAISLEAPGFVDIDDSWIASQKQFITMPALSTSSGKRLVKLRQSTVIQSFDTCFYCIGSSPIRLDIEHTLFSYQPITNVTSNLDSSWITTTKNSRIEVICTDSFLHQISNLIALESDDATRTIVSKDMQSMKNVITQLRDEGTVILQKSPWREPRPWQRYMDSRIPAALALRTEYQHIGPNNLLGQSLRVNNAVAARETKEILPASGRTLIVDGTGAEPGKYSTVNSALGAITDEEETTILLQVHGLVPVKPTEIGNSKVIIKAAEGYSPELTFHRDTVAGPDGEANLFRVHDGELTLEQLKLRMEALRDHTKTLSFVFLTGSGKCRVKSSTVTLKNTGDYNANVMILGDPTGMMAPGNSQKTGKASQARIECIETIIRGTGQLLFVQTSRPFHAQLQQVGTALDGVLVTMDGNRADMSMPGEIAQIQIDRSTCYATRGLLLLRASSPMPQLITLRFQPTNSIFMVNENQSMVRLDGIQAESDLKRKLMWQGRRNCYAGTSVYLTHQQLDQSAMSTPYDALLWSELWGGDDEQAQFLKTIPLSGLLRQSPFHEWEGIDFNIRQDANMPMSYRDLGLPADMVQRSANQLP